MSEGVLAPWRPRPGAWDAAAARHLFVRAGFGATPGQLERALSEGHGATLERFLADELGGADAREPAPPVEPVLAAGDLELLQAWWMARLLSGEAALTERMALLWHGHFATSADKVGDLHAMHAQNELFRARGRGSFRALLQALLRDPALLLWLDGDSNRRGHPNENLARELLELFTLGLGAYGEADVGEAARALTGRGTDGGAFRFRAEHHDAGPKTFLGRSGALDGDDVLAIVLAQPACARHLARVLLGAFVTPAPEPSWVEAVAAGLVAADWELEPVLRTLLASELFQAPRARLARIAAPVELLAVAVRALDARVAPRWAARTATALGQSLFRPPSVKGWDGGRAWIHSGAWIGRHNALVELVEADGAEAGLLRTDLARLVPDGVPAEARARRVLAALLPEGAGRALVAALESAEAGEDRRAALRLQVALVLTSPDFQRL